MEYNRQIGELIQKEQDLNQLRFLSNGGQSKGTSYEMEGGLINDLSIEEQSDFDTDGSDFMDEIGSTSE